MVRDVSRGHNLRVATDFATDFGETVAGHPFVKPNTAVSLNEHANPPLPANHPTPPSFYSGPINCCPRKLNAPNTYKLMTSANSAI